MMRQSMCAAILLTLAACAAGTQTVAMKGSDINPAAQAQIEAKREQGNTRLGVEAKHLAPANKIRDNASEYVVWVEPVDGKAPPQNVGTLQVNDQYEGELQTVTPYEDFKVFITPESSGNAERPSGPEILAGVVR